MILGKDWSTIRKLMVMQGAIGGMKAVEDFATGNPVVFQTDLSKPLKKLAINLLPVQEGSGDPSPSNIRPLLPWGEVGTWTGGKNLYPIAIGEDAFINNGSATHSNNDGALVIVTNESGSASGIYLNSSSEMYKLFSAIPAPFTVSFDIVASASGTVRTIACGVSNTETVGTTKIRVVRTVTEKTIVNFNIYGVNNGATLTVTNLQVESGSSASPYAPYIPVTPHPVDLQKNLCNTGNAVFPYTNNGILFTRNQDGSVTVQRVESSTGNGVMFLLQGGTAEKPLFPSGQYTWTGFPVDSGFTSTNTVLQLTITEKATGTVYQRRQLRINKSTDTFTVTDDYYISDIFIRIDKSETATATFKPMLEVGDTPSAFQPYLPPVYGCELDLTTGEVWGTWKAQAFTGASSENWYFVQVGSSAWYRAYINMPDMKQENDVAILADSYKAVSFDNRSFRQKICMASNVTDNPQVLSIITDETSVNDFKAYLAENPLTIAYKLATPVLLATLTPQQVNALVGVNTVWSDANGQIEVTFLKRR